MWGPFWLRYVSITLHSFRSPTCVPTRLLPFANARYILPFLIYGPGIRQGFVSAKRSLALSDNRRSRFAFTPTSLFIALAFVSASSPPKFPYTTFPVAIHPNLTLVVCHDASVVRDLLSFLVPGTRTPHYLRSRASRSPRCGDTQRFRGRIAVF